MGVGAGALVRGISIKPHRQTWSGAKRIRPGKHRCIYYAPVRMKRPNPLSHSPNLPMISSIEFEASRFVIANSHTNIITGATLLPIIGLFLSRCTPTSTSIQCTTTLSASRDSPTSRRSPRVILHGISTLKQPPLLLATCFLTLSLLPSELVTAPTNMEWT